MAKKKSDDNLTRRMAVFSGHTAGKVERAVEAVAEAVRHHGEQPELVHPDVRAEKSDIHARGVLLGGACLVGGMWLATALLFFYFSYLRHYRASVSPPPLPVAQHGNPLPPEPRLQGSPRSDLQTYLAGQDWELTHYYWIDKNKGQVAIPIERAIQMLAQRGIAPATGAPNPTGTPPDSGTRLTGFEGKVEPEPR